MFALFGAKFAHVCAARESNRKSNVRTSLTLAATAGLLTACIPATVALAGKHPADPTAKVNGVHYSSTIAPYTSLRPSTPAPWRERTDKVAPQAKPDQRDSR